MKSTLCILLLAVILYSAHTKSIPRRAGDASPCTLKCQGESLANPLLNGIEFFGMGYDIITVKALSNIVDLCCSQERPVTVQSITFTCPDYVTVKAYYKTTYNVTAQYVRSMQEYDSVQAQAFNVTEDYQQYAGVGSSEYGDAKFYIDDNDNHLTSTNNSGVVYAAQVNLPEFPSLVPDFIDAINDLPLDYDDYDIFWYSYKPFIDTYGTHMSVKVEFGGAIQQSSFTDQSFYSTQGDSATINNASNLYYQSVNLDEYKNTKNVSDEFRQSTYSAQLIIKGGSGVEGQINFDEWEDSVFNQISGQKYDLIPINQVFTPRWTQDTIPVGDLAVKAENMRQAIEYYIQTSTVCQEDCSITYGRGWRVGARWQTAQCMYANLVSIGAHGFASCAHLPYVLQRQVVTAACAVQDSAVARVLQYAYIRPHNSKYVLDVFGGVFVVRTDDASGHTQCVSPNAMAQHACACTDSAREEVVIGESVTRDGLARDAYVMCQNEKYRFVVRGYVRAATGKCVTPQAQTGACRCPRDHDAVEVFAVESETAYMCVLQGGLLRSYWFD